MPQSIERVRNGCALHGALKACKAIQGVIPIVHSNPGCSLQEYLGGSSYGGSFGAGHLGGFEIPSSNIQEKQIIFGGTSRLREQIKNTLKVLRGDLYVVLSGCSTEIVGDDIPAMTKEARDQGYPIIHISTPGFRGSIHDGYKLFFKGVVNQIEELYKKAGGSASGLVNLIGVIPEQDVFWEGNLEKLKKLLETFGLKVNTLFGYNQTIESWKDISRAELNISVSPWGGEIARYLKEKFDTEYLDFKGIPFGAAETGSFLRQITRKLEIDSKAVEAFIRAEEARILYQLRKIADVYFNKDLQKDFVLVGESYLVTGLWKLLYNQLGFISKAVIITDDVPQSYKELLDEDFGPLLAETGTELLYSEDGGVISDAIKKHNPELVIGSSFEKEAASALNAPLLQVSYPLNGRIILNRSYAGFNGDVELLQDLGEEILRNG